MAAVRDSIKETDAIIFEDYGKGFVTTELVTQVARDAAAAGKIVGGISILDTPSTGAALQLSNQTALKRSLQRGSPGATPTKARKKTPSLSALVKRF